MKRLPMKRLLLLITLLMFLWPTAAIPAEQVPAKAKTDEKAGDPALAPATLKIQNRPIVTLRGTMLGYTPKQRVEAAEARIKPSSKGEKRAPFRQGRSPRDS